MFTRERWRQQIAERLDRFARNPHQEIRLAGVSTPLPYLVAQTLSPFCEALHQEPINAIETLAAITRGSGADQIVKSAFNRHYQSAVQADREMRAGKEYRLTTEDVLIELQTILIARQSLNSSHDEWLRTSLERSLDQFPGEFGRLRRVLSDPGVNQRHRALHDLRSRAGSYTSADLVLIWDGLQDSSAEVRATAARLLAAVPIVPPKHMVEKLLAVALRDFDARTRAAAARAFGILKERVVTPELLDDLARTLFESDRFVRAATAILIGQLGAMAATPDMINHLATLLYDTDPYTREAAARALEAMGPPAATPEVLEALQRLLQDSEVQVYQAAEEALNNLRRQRPARPAPEPAA